MKYLKSVTNLAREIGKIDRLREIIKDQTEEIMFENEVEEINNKITDLYNSLKKLNSEAHKYLNEKVDNNLAVVKNVCDFPLNCNKRKTCTKDYCNADVCDNGYAYRMS